MEECLAPKPAAETADEPTPEPAAEPAAAAAEKAARPWSSEEVQMMSWEFYQQFGYYPDW